MKHRTLSENNHPEMLRLLAEQVSRAVWMEDTAQIIACLAKLANCALDTGYVRKKELMDWLDVVSVDTAIKVLFDIVEQCTAGVTESYSELYCLCTQLTCKILNTNVEQVFTQEVPIMHDHSAADWS